MKKLIAVTAAILAMLALLSSCNDGVTVKLSPTGVIQNEYDSKKQSVIGTFGVSIENSSIVGYRNSNGECLEYVVVSYKDGKKTSEATYYFYHSEEYYQNALQEFGKADHIVTDDSEAFIKIASNNANTGSYASDFEKLDKDFFIKTPTGDQ